MKKYCLAFLCFLFSSLHPCQVIYVNGTSSVGKTTLVRALQEALEMPYMRIGIDQVIEMMPEKVNNWSGGCSELGFSWKSCTDSEGHLLQILEMGPFAKKIPSAMRKISSALVKSGFHLIIDDVAMEDNSYASWKEALEGVDVLWVGLTAPIEVIEKREKERGDRLVGQARAALPLVHREFIYDLFINTHETPTSQAVIEIVEACKSKIKKSQIVRHSP